jgi:hypothetical protein
VYIIYYVCIILLVCIYIHTDRYIDIIMDIFIIGNMINLGWIDLGYMLDKVYVEIGNRSRSYGNVEYKFIMDIRY